MSEVASIINAHALGAKYAMAFLHGLVDKGKGNGLHCNSFGDTTMPPQGALGLRLIHEFVNLQAGRGCWRWLNNLRCGCRRLVFELKLLLNLF